MSDLLERSDHCFVCGEKNPIGLKAKVEGTGPERFIKIKLDANYEGYDGIIHGGILVTLMDEVMAYSVSDGTNWGVTASIEVKFRKKVESGKYIIVYGKLLEKSGSWAKAEARITYEGESTILAEARGLFKLITIR
ncbi:MAG: PaaI family thioesterase [bacterium]|nr:PaaI family thioesterase [bacterium]